MRFAVPGWKRVAQTFRIPTFTAAKVSDGGGDSRPIRTGEVLQNERRAGRSGVGSAAIHGVLLASILLTGCATTADMTPRVPGAPLDPGYKYEETIDSKHAFKRSFDAGLATAIEERKSLLAQGHVPGELLARSEIPIVKNVGVTIRSLGRLLTSPLTLVESAVRTDRDITEQAFDDFARGFLGIIGLEHIVMGGWDKPAGVTGSIDLPKPYAEAILEARQEWHAYSHEEQQRDYSRGMKKWHTLSNAKLAGDAGIVELPLIFLGGLIHEVEPGSVSSEVEGQGFARWLVDTPLDVVANAAGMLGGLLLPQSTHAEYARIVGNLIPGPSDPFEDATAGQLDPFEDTTAADSKTSALR